MPNDPLPAVPLMSSVVMGGIACDVYLNGTLSAKLTNSLRMSAGEISPVVLSGKLVARVPKRASLFVSVIDFPYSL